MRALDVTGQTFGRLTAVRRVGSRPGGATWQVRCVCGEERTVLLCNLRAGLTRSCGCLAREATIKRHTKHGHTPYGTRPPPTYMTWIDMVQRCTNPNDTRWRDYGGRGIAVCERWRGSFALFLVDMGERPPGMSLDRIDVNGNYEPANCRWADDTTQARNKRNNRYLTLEGTTMLLVEWAEKLGIPRATLAMRVSRGWPDERVLSQPKGARCPRT